MVFGDEDSCIVKSAGGGGDCWLGCPPPPHLRLQRFAVWLFGLAAESMCRVVDGNKVSRGGKVAHLGLLETKKEGRKGGGVCAGEEGGGGAELLN